eukprot:9451229-Pyramimonas_sp.AAC.2
MSLQLGVRPSLYSYNTSACPPGRIGSGPPGSPHTPCHPPASTAPPAHPAKPITRRHLLPSALPQGHNARAATLPYNRLPTKNA